VTSIVCAVSYHADLAPGGAIVLVAAGAVVVAMLGEALSAARR
jgi:ABC-type Mn2+/Zn2+ transport system permease subunit